MTVTQALPPVSPKPWTQKDDASIVRDAKGAPVSFVQNAPYVMHCVVTADEAVAALVDLLPYARTAMPPMRAGDPPVIERALDIIERHTGVRP